jgi:hypothetical protein
MKTPSTPAANGGTTRLPTPAHYDKPVQPWDLIEGMESSGKVLVDHLRAASIEWTFRNKADLKEDLQKSVSALLKAISLLP